MYDKDGKVQQVTLQIKAKRTDLEARLGLKESFAAGPVFNPVKVDHLKLHGGWIEVRLTDEQMDLKVSTLDVQKSLGLMRIKVYRKVHVQAKIADDDNDNKWLPLGEEYRTNRMNFTVKPIDCPLGSFDWSQFPTIPCTKVVVFQGKQYKVTEQLQYTIGGDSLVDAETTRKMGETCYTICNGIYGCKQLRIVCRGECARKRRAEANYRSQIKDARASTGSYAEARKKVRADSKAAYEHDKGKAKAMLQPRDSDSDASSSASQKPLRDVKCPYLLGGLCKKGKNCKMSHAFSSTDPAQIPCKLERRRVSGVCVAGSSCI
jgi:hypothetical protein